MDILFQQNWSVPLKVFYFLKQELYDVDPLIYMDYLNKISDEMKKEILMLCGVKDVSLEDAISHVFIKHRPGTNEYLLKYKPIVQYGSLWNNFYRQCRGTVLDLDRMVAYHSFDKFFNVNETEENNKEVLLVKSKNVLYRVMNKFDGSLIMFYFNKGEWKSYTNGFFESEQSIWAMEYAYKHNLFDKFNKNYTYMFEAIYPQNKIVVDYEDQEMLVPLAKRNILTGKLDFLCESEAMSLKDCLESIDKYKAFEKEGWVISFEDGHLVKIKCKDYVMIHKMKDQINPEGIFEMIVNDTLDDIWSYLSDDLREKAEKIIKRFVDWEVELKNKLNKIDKNNVRSVLSVFSEPSFEQWYAFKYVRGKINPEVSPLKYVSNFSKIEHIFY